MLKRNSILAGLTITALVLLFLTGRYSADPQKADNAVVYASKKDQPAKHPAGKILKELDNPSNGIWFYLRSITYSIIWNFRQ